MAGSEGEQEGEEAMTISPEDIMPEGSGPKVDWDYLPGPVVEGAFAISGEAYRAKAGRDVIFLELLVRADGFAKPVRMSFPAGDPERWTIAPDKQSITPIKGVNKLGDSVTAGIFCTHILKMLGDGDVQKGAQAAAARGFLPTQIGFYIGMDSVWVRTGVDIPGKAGKKIRMYVPTGFLKFVENATPATATNASKGQATSSDFVSILKSLAKGKDKKALKQALLKDETTKGNKELLARVFNKGLIEELESSGELLLVDGVYQ